MARVYERKCRLCRKEGQKLFLKGNRCYSPKCPLEKKGAVPPGQHGTRRQKRPSDYSHQLREKQKAKATYGVLERQFKQYFKKAIRVRKETGKALLQTLESRLDNILFRLGFVSSRSIARQIVNHGHVMVDNKNVNIPSYQIKPGQIISLTAKGLSLTEVKKSLEEKDKKIPVWLERKAAVGRMIRLPEVEEIDSEINTDLIVEFYSR